MTGRRPSLIATITVWALLVFALAGFAVFLANAGLGKADQWSSVVSGMIAIVGLIGLIARFAVPRAARLLSRRGSTPAAEASIRLQFLGDSGRPPLVSDVDPVLLGVKQSIRLAPDGDTDLPPYVSRDIDQEIQWLIPEGGLILLHGRAAAGKTRTAFEMVRRLCPNHDMLIPVDAHAVQDIMRLEPSPVGAVIWLDDLERYLTPGGLDTVFVELLPTMNAVIVATIRNDELSKIDQVAFGTHDDPGISAKRFAGDLLRRFARRIAVPNQLSEDEEARAAGSTDDRITQASTQHEYGFAEFLAAGPSLMARWTIGDGWDFLVRQAIISAAVDCRRAGYTRPVPSEALSRLFRGYLPQGMRKRDDLPDFAAVLPDAARPVLGASSCIIPREGGFQAHDYLMDRTDDASSPIAARPIPDQVWAEMIEIATTDENAEIGEAAYSAGRNDIAGTAYLCAVPGDSHKAMFGLGVLATDRGDPSEAEAWYRRSIEGGDPSPMLNLAVLLEDQGRHDESEEWTLKAARTGHSLAVYRLALISQKQGDSDTAQALYRLAANAGLRFAMTNLANILVEQGEPEEARSLWQRAAERGDIMAMANLGIVAEEEGRLPDAEALLRRAATGDESLDDEQHDCKVLYSAFLTRRGRDDEAVRWLERAAFAGHVPAMMLLLTRAISARDPDSATVWAIMAAEKGETSALYYLGERSAGSSGAQEARSLLEELSNSGETAARASLGFLLTMTGETERGIRLLQEPAQRGDFRAQHCLAEIREAEGATAEAEFWYRKALEHGPAEIKSNLGHLLMRSGRSEEAEVLFRQAADAEVTDGMYNLGLLLDGRGHTDEAMIYLQRASDAGDRIAANKIGRMKRSAGQSDAAARYFALSLEQEGAIGEIMPLHPTEALLVLRMRIAPPPEKQSRTVPNDTTGREPGVGDDSPLLSTLAELFEATHEPRSPMELYAFGYRLLGLESREADPPRWIDRIDPLDLIFLGLVGSPALSEPYNFAQHREVWVDAVRRSSHWKALIRFTELSVGVSAETGLAIDHPDVLLRIVQAAADDYLCKKRLPRSLTDGWANRGRSAYRQSLALTDFLLAPPEDGVQRLAGLPRTDGTDGMVTPQVAVVEGLHAISAMGIAHADGPEFLLTCLYLGLVQIDDEQALAEMPGCVFGWAYALPSTSTVARVVDTVLAATDLDIDVDSTAMKLMTMPEFTRPVETQDRYPVRLIGRLPDLARELGLPPVHATYTGEDVDDYYHTDDVDGDEMAPDAVFDRIVEAVRASGIDPAFAEAIREVGYIVTDQNFDGFSREEIEAWTEAVERSRRLGGDPD
ncbi:tetratricopeptide repeat protein [Catenuloplanes sp. NPDC051500]|uniref:SEL1-like repeat protein n=1 Tax=Catenuloplanes sp. NPDC051500 TaxID=3363959 RepID=UPI003792ACBC